AVPGANPRRHPGRRRLPRNGGRGGPASRRLFAGTRRAVSTDGLGHQSLFRDHGTNQKALPCDRNGVGRIARRHRAADLHQPVHGDCAVAVSVSPGVLSNPTRNIETVPKPVSTSTLEALRALQTSEPVVEPHLSTRAVFGALAVVGLLAAVAITFVFVRDNTLSTLD